MGAYARVRRGWRAIAVLALPGLVLVAADRAGASPPDPTPPPGSFSATPLTPATDPPTSSVPVTPPSSTEPPSTDPAATEPPATDVPASDVPSTEAPADPDGSFTAEALTPTDRVTGSRAPTSRLAETDPALLGRTDATPVEVLVKLDYDSIATYAGDLAGLPATSPSVTGRELTHQSNAERTYDSFIASQEQTFASDLQATVPEATIGTSLRTVYGGVRVVVPANRVADVLALPNVVAVQQDEMRQLLTDSSRDFIGATTLYPALGGNENAGRGVIFGVLDTGAWPEHPSLADQGNLARPPRRFGGGTRTCDFGDNPLTPANDPFTCNKKLIGGRAFLTAYLSNPARAAAERYKTARDSNGHGTHTGTTSAGNVVATAPVLGVDQGPVGGIAPGAWVSVYKVCGAAGCFSSDSAAAVQQAIYDGVDVINFSISGGTNPATDPVELAFLDAYAAGVFVAASAGNAGPAEETANHLSPWTTTVAASTQTRAFQSTLTLSATGGGATFTGASITAGVTTPTPVVMASAEPYSDALCRTRAPAGSFAGKIVACQRGSNTRVDKGYNVLQGGAVGMILYNPSPADIETDNHWLPTVHLADGTDFADMAANPGVTATFTAGTKKEGEGDVMAAFSSRGPAGSFIKPDVTAPGVEILAGHTPTPEAITEGPPGQYFQAIAGTSMSSPHVAGSAILLKALHPTWTPGQIKSALMTTAITDVVKENLVTPADPFDFGSGRIDLTVAGNPGLTFDASAADMIAYGTDPLTAVHLNQPSINVPLLPGRIETTRVATNVSGARARYVVEATAPDGSTISVTPGRLNLGRGQSATLDITIAATPDDGNAGQQFGEIRLVPQGGGLPTLHMPVAFVPTQGEVELSSECEPGVIGRGDQSFCTVTAQNFGSNPVVVDLTTSVNRNLTITGARNASVTRGLAAKLDVELAGTTPGIPSIGPGELAGYVPLDLLGVVPEPVGDEEIVNFDVPAFVYAGATYDLLGVDSNGYLVVGGGTTVDNECCAPMIPSPSRPNNVLAPFWTDLTGAGAPGLYAATLTDGVDEWIVIEWRVNVWNTTSRRVFQVWIGLNGEEDITFAYDPAHLPANPAGQKVVVGAESIDGSAGDTLGDGVLPTEDLRVTSTEPLAGGTVSYEVFVRGDRVGDGLVTTEMESEDLFGTTVVESPVTVTRP